MGEQECPYPRLKSINRVTTENRAKHQKARFGNIVTNTHIAQFSSSLDNLLYSPATDDSFGDCLLILTGNWCNVFLWLDAFPESNRNA